MDKYNIVVELAPEEVLTLTTVIKTFRDTTKALDIETPKEIRNNLCNILSKIAFELHEAVKD